jgi:hypothetical protein
MDSGGMLQRLHKQLDERHQLIADPRNDFLVLVAECNSHAFMFSNECMITTKEPKECDSSRTYIELKATRKQ